MKTELDNKIFKTVLEKQEPTIIEQIKSLPIEQQGFFLESWKQIKEGNLTQDGFKELLIKKGYANKKSNT